MNKQYWMIRTKDGKDHYFQHRDSPISCLCGASHLFGDGLYMLHSTRINIGPNEIWLYFPHGRGQIKITKAPMNVCRNCKRMILMEELGE